jgi:ribonuclease HI
MKIEIYTDGSATIASKPGGYGWVLVVDGVKASEGNGHIEKGTNNDAEMEAAIWGLVAAYKYVTANKIALETGDVSLCSDSQITLGWANGTYRFKQEHKYTRFLALKELMVKLKAGTRWVRGHSGDENNERCDELANLGRLKMGPNDKLPVKKHGKRAKTEKKEELPKLGIEKPKIGNKRRGTISLHYKNVLKIIDLDANMVEDYDESVHGKRESFIEVK